MAGAAFLLLQQSFFPLKQIYSRPSQQRQQRQPAFPEPEPDEDEDAGEDLEIVNGERQDAVELSPSSPSSSDDGSEQAMAENRNRALETLDIINAETQQPDFDIPLPPDSDVDSDDLSFRPPFISSKRYNIPKASATSPTPRNSQTTKLDAYVDKMVLYGYKEASIISALKCTSMRPDLAELVLLEEKTGKGNAR